jgi:hypothetical protein
MNLRESSLRASIGLLILVVWGLWLWQPQRQARLHQRSLLKAVEQRDWEELADLLDPQYTDHWGFDKETAPGAAQKAFSQFFFLTVRTEDPQWEFAGGSARFMAKLKLEGSGGPLTEVVIDRVNSLRTPFTFEWIHRSWKPWDWKLEMVEQEELKIPEVDSI